MSLFSRSKPPLTSIEHAELVECEQRIERGFQAYRDAGKALARIRDGNLYREKFETFDQYCQDRWRMTPQHAGRLIAAAEVARNLEPIGSIPANEAQARELAPLPKTEQVAVWQEVTERTKGKPTAAAITAAVRKRRPGKSKKRPKAIRVRVPGAIVVIQPGKGWTTPLAALRAAVAKLADSDLREATKDAA